MHYNDIPEKPLIPGVNNKVDPAQKIYFFQREDGEIIHTQAQEAWKLYMGRTQVLGTPKLRTKLIGVGNGIAFRNAVIESQAIFRDKGLSFAQDRLRQGLQEELAAAKGHIEAPPNFDKMGPGAAYL